MNLKETNDTVVESNEVEEDIDIGKSKITKIRKAVIHESAHTSVIQTGMDKMNSMSLPAIRHREGKRVAREQVAIRD